MGWAMITGATGGLGQTFAAQAAHDGLNLVLSDMPGTDLDAVAAPLRKTGREVVCLPADLGSQEATDTLWAQATNGRDLDVLINNAGLGRHGPLGSVEGGGLERDRAVVEVNIRALTDLTAHAVAHMRPRGRGDILNVASIAAWTPAPNLASYHASKSYVLSLSRAVRGELRGSGVNLTALCPSPIDTGFFGSAGANGVWLTRMLPPLTPERVAQVGWRAMRQGKAVRIAGMMGRISVILGALGPIGLSTRVAGWLWTKR